MKTGVVLSIVTLTVLVSLLNRLRTSTITDANNKDVNNNDKEDHDNQDKNNQRSLIFTNGRLIPPVFSMRFVEESFLTTAPWIFTSSEEYDVSMEVMFSILLDDGAWQFWHPEIQDIRWSTPLPRGVDSKRTVVFSDLLFRILLAGPVTLAETFDVFVTEGDELRKFGFYMTAINRPTFLSYNAIREEYLVEPISENKCRFTRTVAIDPAFITKNILGFLVFPRLVTIFEELCADRMTQAIADGNLPRSTT